MLHIHKSFIFRETNFYVNKTASDECSVMVTVNATKFDYYLLIF